MKFLKNYTKFNHLPQQFAIPVLGNFFHPYALKVGWYLSHLSKEFGGLFVFWPPCADPCVIISDPSIARDILTDQKTFPKGEDYTKKLALFLGQGLLTSDQETHSKDKACIGRFFTRISVERRLDRISLNTNLFIERFFNDISGVPFDVEEMFRLLTLQIFADHAFGINYFDNENMEMGQWITDSFGKGASIVGEHIILRLPVYSWIPRIKKLTQHVTDLHSHFGEMISRRASELEANPDMEITNCVSGMLQANVPKNKILDQLTTLIGAGHETTAYLTCYLSYLFATNPEVQAKAKKEIREVLGDRTTITPQDVAKLQYLKNCIYECLRIFPSVPVISRVATKDVFLESCSKIIPQGANVFISMFLMNRNQEIWENPYKFCPERFETLDAANFAKFGFFPFGYGARACIGNQFALIEEQVIMALILQKFTFAPVPGFKPKIALGISLRSKNGFRVIANKD